MINKEIVLGFIIGIVSSVIGSFLFVYLFTEYSLLVDYSLLSQYGLLNKVITLGTILSVLAFIFFFYKKKDAIAKGILFSIIALVILTFFA